MSNGQGDKNSGGAEDARVQALYEARKKSALLAYALGAVLGVVGAHRFYIGGRSTRYGWVLVGLFVVLVLLAVSLFIQADSTEVEVDAANALLSVLVYITGMLFIGLLYLEGVLTFFAVRKRNRELLEEARAQGKPPHA